MFCQKCGFQNEEGVNFCAKCGADLRVYQNANAGDQQQNNQQPYNQQPNNQPPYQQPIDANQYVNGSNPYSQNPGSPYPYNNPGYLPPVNSHMVLSVVSIFFCLILGIIAIVYSNKSKNSYNMGDYNGAVSNANTAKILAIIGIIVGTLVSILYIAAAVAAAGSIN